MKLSAPLLATAAGLAVVSGASAADLPSKKAAPVNYVRICDAYGAGFFYVPGTETCVKLGGYVRAEYQYVPGQATYSPATGAVSQFAAAQSTTGFEMRGRIDVDARTPTALGTARTYIRLRGANTSGIRNTKADNGGTYRFSDASSTGVTIESAMIQWAGFTFGVAPENYAMMPSFMFNANPWTGFPNGMKQIAYTATFGGGWSATIALEDRNDWAYNLTYADRLSTAANVVGNIRLDQSWGFAAVHGAVGNNSLRSDYGTATVPGVVDPGFPARSNTHGQSTFGSWAIGTTVSFKLPMIAAGDQVWFTANYAHGLLGALTSKEGLSVISTSSNHRLFGGALRDDTNLIPVGVDGAGQIRVDDVTGWNAGMAYTHYWTPTWRSNFTAGYVSVTPPSSTFTQWGDGHFWLVAGSVIYSPAKNFDIGFEVEYAQLHNEIQNPTAAYVAAGYPGRDETNVTTKLRVQRSF